MTTLKAIEKKIEKVKANLLAIGDMHPGSLSQQYNVCGKKGCRCKDEENPQKHGPYYQLSYVHKGKSTSRFIKPGYFAEMKKQVENYKKFKLLSQDWIDLAMLLSQEKLIQAKNSEVK